MTHKSEPSVQGSLDRLPYLPKEETMNGVTWLKDLDERFEEAYQRLKDAEAKKDRELALQADDLIHDVIDDVTVRLVSLFEKLS